AVFVQAQPSERLYAGVATLLDNNSGNAGLYVTAFDAPNWKNVAWPNFSVRATATIVAGGEPRILLGGPLGIVRPFTNPTGWQLLTADQMGEVLDLKVDSENGHTIFAATTRGVYVSEDRGKTWQARNQGLLNQFVSCLLLDPKQDRRLLAGTEAGLYESFNEGKEWTLVAFAEIPIRALLREPESWPGIYWVGTEYHGLFESFDGGEKFDQVDMGSDSVSIYALAGGGATAPIYAGLFEKGLYRASSPGENWAALEGSQQLGSVLTILPLEDRQTIFVGTHQNGVMRSTDYGHTWQSYGLKGVPVRTLFLGGAEWHKP
ncbi:MAG: hypothetical protein AAB354_03980, partial [candidate division KSB1 bacterium]